MQNTDRIADSQVEHLFEAVKTIARAFGEASPETLSEVHALLRDHFMRVTEPPGRYDNVVEQRVVGTLWAELEEVLDHRRPSFH
jgi:hypothetical protein